MLKLEWAMRLHHAVWPHCIHHHCMFRRIQYIWVMVFGSPCSDRMLQKYSPKSKNAKWLMHHSLKQEHRKIKTQKRERKKQSTMNYSTVFDNTIIKYHFEWLLWNHLSTTDVHLPFWITFLQTVRWSNWFGGGGAQSTYAQRLVDSSTLFASNGSSQNSASDVQCQHLMANTGKLTKKMFFDFFWRSLRLFRLI